MRHSSKKLTQEEFIRRSSEAHNNYYDYSLAVYKNSSTSVSIICPEHGITTQHAGNHMAGYRTKCFLGLTFTEALEHIRDVLSTSGISGYSEISYTDSTVRSVT